MKRRWLLPVAGLLLLGGLCGGVWWSMIERSRFSRSFDLGGGHTLTVWSIRTDSHPVPGFYLDKNPLTVYYRVDGGGREVVPTTFLDHDDQGVYEFRMVSAENGRLAAVYEVKRAAGNHCMLILYDADSGESWPRLRNDESLSMPDVLPKWRDRYRRLKAENPDLPSPPPFEE